MFKVIKTKYYTRLSNQISFRCLFSPTPTTCGKSITPTTNQVSFGCGCEVCQLGTTSFCWKIHKSSRALLKSALNVCCPFSTSTDVIQKNTLPATYSGFSHHPAVVLKAVHCVHITPLTCWFWLDLGPCWHTVLSAYSTFVLHFHRNTNLWDFTSTKLTQPKDLNHIIWTLK